MKIFFTDSSFLYDGRPLPHLPFLCDSGMKFTSVPNEYLRYIAVVKGGTRSSHTWRTYGMALFEYFSFLEANDLQWHTIAIYQLAGWRNAMLDRECKRNTINQRVRIVLRFYRWAIREGYEVEAALLNLDAQSMQSKARYGRKKIADGYGATQELMLRTFSSEPKFLRLEQAIQFCESLSPARVRLMAYVMLLTGLRREETVALDYRVLPTPAGNSPDKNLPMKLDGELSPTKGIKPRMVMVPFDLAVALQNYLMFTRPKLARLRFNKGLEESKKLFLAEDGQELSCQGLTAAFRKFSIKTGIKCNPHLLRHTYGTYELLRISQTRNQSSALLWVKERMGHSSVTTTEQYIHASDLISQTHIDGYQSKLCEALRAN